MIFFTNRRRAADATVGRADCAGNTACHLASVVARTARQVFFSRHDHDDESAIVGAGACAAEPADLRAHRRGAGRGRLPVLAGDPRHGLWLRWVALAIFIAAGITDLLDGYVARVWGQQSSFGRMLDPIADKLLVASCLLMLAADEHHPRLALWAAIIILCREILVSGLREYLAELRVSVPVTRLAKWKTFLQLVAVGFLIAGEAGDRVLPITTLIGIGSCSGSPRS